LVREVCVESTRTTHQKNTLNDSTVLELIPLLV